MHESKLKRKLTWQVQMTIEGSQKLHEIKQLIEEVLEDPPHTVGVSVCLLGSQVVHK